MYNLFLDEEGFLPSFNHYILGGCIVSTEHIKEINNILTEKKIWHLSSAFIDLKQLADPNKRIIVLEKNIRKEFDNYVLKDILNEVFKSIDKYDFRFITTIIEKNKWYETCFDKKNYEKDIYYIAYKSLVGRYDDFLKLKNSPGNMVIESNNNHLITNLKTAHGLMIDPYNEFKNIKNITDSFHFSYGINTNLIQFAYLFVKSCFNLLENNIDECFQKFFPYIHSKNGNIKDTGIEVFPKEYIEQTKLNNYLIMIGEG